jgi:hypothetical protein
MDDSLRSCRVVLEVGSKKTFASALDWPGWSRSGKDEPTAIESLLDYGDRYAVVTALAGLDVTLPGAPMVIDRQSGDMTTDFGAPGRMHDVEREPVDRAELERQLSLLRASWALFDEIAATVTPELRKGPRGGGRNRDGIVAHVVEADRNYARRIGVRTSKFDAIDRVALHEHREAVFAIVPELRGGEPVSPNGWPVRYALRRMAWHILDHAWEMQDKTLA